MHPLWRESWEKFPSPDDKGCYFKIFSTWAETVDETEVAALTAAGFTIARSWRAQFDADTPRHDGINIQMHTALAGLRVAEGLGATHAVRLRSDLVISDPRTFFSSVFVASDRLCLFGLWCGRNGGPLDYLTGGPIAHMFAMYSPPYQKPGDGTLPEQFLMESYMRARPGGALRTHADFCHAVDFFAERTPLGLLIWRQHGNNGARDVLMSYRECPGLMPPTTDREAYCAAADTRALTA